MTNIITIEESAPNTSGVKTQMIRIDGRELIPNPVLKPYLFLACRVTNG